MSYTPGRRQTEILQHVRTGATYVAGTPSLQLSCRQLHDRGYLLRDAVDAYTWTISPKGEELAAAMERQGAPR